MTAHGFTHHRRAARAMVRRKATNVKALDERLDIFPGLAETDTPSITDFFADPKPGNGHHGLPGILTISTPSLIPDLPITTPLTSLTPLTTLLPTTSRSIPTPSTTSTSSTISLPTISPVIPLLQVPTTSTIAPTTITLVTTISSASPGASTTAAASSSGVSTGAVVGGVGAGIVAVAAIGIAVSYFIRRVRKRELDEAAGFDARDFRRSAVMLTDPPTHEDTINRGYNPPPTMMERPPAPVPASAWGYTEPYYGINAAGLGTWNQSQDQHPSYSPSQGFNSNLPSPTGPSAHAFGPVPYAPLGQGPSTAGPGFLPSPREQSSAVESGLTRQASNHSTGGRAPLGSPQAAIPPYPALTRNPTVKSAQIPPDDYVDLNRSSVSPFQAAQYAEISRQLYIPSDTPSSALSSPAQLYATQQKDLPPIPPDRKHGTLAHSSPAGLPHNGTGSLTSNFDHSTPQAEFIPSPAPAPALQPVPPPEPAAIHSAPTQEIAPVQPPSPPPSTLHLQTLHLQALSTDSLPQVELEFPVPPSPAISYSSRHRVESLPPTLPEITVQDRSSVSSYIPRSPMIGSGYISGMTDTSGMSALGSAGLQPIGKFVPTPSPLASSFAASPYEGHQSVFAAAQESAIKESSRTTTTEAKAKSAGDSKLEHNDDDGKRPTTVYDPDDAYGGF